MPTSSDKGLFRLQAEIAKALAHPLRLEILTCLREGELPFGELQAQVKVSKPNLSQHLAVMRRAGIVIDRRVGNTTCYRLAYPGILKACRCLAETLHSHLSRGARLAVATRPRNR
jgi:ArsR family transcriptional regulator